MKLQFAALILMVAAVSGFSQSSFSHSRPATVDIYVNSRDDSGRLLGPSTTLASDIFQKIGVRLNWHKGEMRPSLNAIVIRTLERAPESATPGALAASDPSQASRSRFKTRSKLAIIFLEERRTMTGVVVGYVLAHELAHVMQGMGGPPLGIRDYSRHTGRTWDFHNMVFHKLVFTAADVELIHKGLSLPR